MQPTSKLMLSSAPTLFGSTAIEGPLVRIWLSIQWTDADLTMELFDLPPHPPPHWTAGGRCLQTVIFFVHAVNNSHQVPKADKAGVELQGGYVLCWYNQLAPTDLFSPLPSNYSMWQQTD